MYRITRCLIQVFLIICMVGCNNYDEYFSIQNTDIGWENNEFVLYGEGFLYYNFYDNNGDINQYCIANNVLDYKKSDDKFFIISDDRYCVIDKNNMCKVYVYCVSDKEAVSKNNILNSNSKYYSVDYLQEIDDEKIKNISSYNDFSDSEKRILEELSKKINDNNIIFENQYLKLIKKYSYYSFPNNCLYYCNEDGTRSKLLDNVSEYKIVDNRIYFSNKPMNSDLDERFSAVFEDTNVRVYNIYTMETEDKYYINDNIKELKNFSEFTEEEQEIIKNMGNSSPNTK